jgi:hypothetical protein
MIYSIPLGKIFMSDIPKADNSPSTAWDQAAPPTLAKEDAVPSGLQKIMAGRTAIEQPLTQVMSPGPSSPSRSDRLDSVSLEEAALLLQHEEPASSVPRPQQSSDLSSRIQSNALPGEATSPPVSRLAAEVDSPLQKSTLLATTYDAHRITSVSPEANASDVSRGTLGTMSTPPSPRGAGLSHRTR